MTKQQVATKHLRHRRCRLGAGGKKPATQMCAADSERRTAFLSSSSGWEATIAFSDLQEKNPNKQEQQDHECQGFSSQKEQLLCVAYW